MKKIIPTILPSLLIFTFIWIDSMFPESKYIILGIYFLFPIIFIIQGMISSSIGNMIIGCLLSSIAVIIPTSIWYNMTSMVIPIIIYISLAIFVFIIKQNKKTDKS